MGIELISGFSVSVGCICIWTNTLAIRPWDEDGMTYSDGVCGRLFEATNNSTLICCNGLCWSELSPRPGDEWFSGGFHSLCGSIICCNYGKTFAKCLRSFNCHHIVRFLQIWFILSYFSLKLFSPILTLFCLCHAQNTNNLLLVFVFFYLSSHSSVPLCAVFMLMMMWCHLLMQPGKTWFNLVDRWATCSCFNRISVHWASSLVSV